MRRSAHSLTLACALIASVTTACHAQAEAAFATSGTVEAPAPPSALSVHAARTTDSPVLDGRLDETAWALAVPADAFRQVEPVGGAPAGSRTDVRVLATADALYIGARLYDASPDSVVARLFRRDANEFSDWFYCQVDSYDDHRTAFVFGVNPRGVQRDYLLFDDSKTDPDWDAVWQSAAAIDESGWTAEIRIPYSQLRFRSGGGRVGWGINFVREVARRGEVDSWSPLSTTDSRVVSLFGRLVGIGDVRPPVGLEVMPFATAGLARAPSDAADPFSRPYSAASRLGVDLRYRLAGGLTATATVNPDFSQVEGDPSEINLSAFESYQSERRGFFLEGSNVFNTPNQQLFYSRRVGRTPQGYAPGAAYAESRESSTILGAAKMTGQTGPWSVGVLTALTQRETVQFVDADGIRDRAVVEPMTGYVVGRALRTWGNGGTALGATVTGVQRQGAGEGGLGELRSNALAAGLDLTRRFAGDRYAFTASAYGSTVGGSAEAIALTQASPQHGYLRTDAAHLAFDPARRSLSGYSLGAGVTRLSGTWTYGASAHADSPGFETNDLGYLRRSDQAWTQTFVAVNRQPQGGAVRSYEATAYQGATWTFGREQTENRFGLVGNVTLRSLWSSSARLEWAGAALDPDALRGGPALATDPVVRAALSGQTDRRRALQLYSYADASTAVGGRYRALYMGAGLVYRPSTSTSISVDLPVSVSSDPYQYVTTMPAGGGDPDGASRYIVGEVRQKTVGLTLRAEGAFTPNLSLQLYAQPFIGAGSYGRFAEVVSSKAQRAGERVQELGDRLTLASGDYALDGVSAFGAPDFTVLDLRSTVVLRWLYRPGSTAYVVWTHGQDAYRSTGTLSPLTDLPDLLGSPAHDVIQVKVTTWFGL